jgi:hypothetical protein
MSNLRPYMAPAFGSERLLLPRGEMLKLLYKSVARRRTLIKGKLKDDDGHFCAIGALASDCDTGKTQKLIASKEFIDEVAAINDKLGDTVSSKQRWGFVMKWLREEIAKLK